MKAVHYNDRLVAFARGRQIRLHPDIASRHVDDPARRWALALATYASRVDVGQAPGPYSEARATAHARGLLMPTHEFAPLAAATDQELACRFAVPREQVFARRAELGLVWN